MSLRQRFGNRIRQLRLERRQTQEEFWVGFLKMSVDFGSMVERGITAPSFETIETLCGSLGLSESELFDFGESPDGTNRGRVKKTAQEKKRSRKKIAPRKGSK